MHRIVIRNCNWILRYAQDDESKYSPGTAAGVTVKKNTTIITDRQILSSLLSIAHPRVRNAAGIFCL